MNEMPSKEPALVSAATLAESDIGSFEWDSAYHADILTVSNDARTTTWTPRKPKSLVRRLWNRINRQIDFYPPAWIPAPTRLHLHSGAFRWEFRVDEMASAQIGLGFLLLWDIGPDWGFFGYLGSSSTAWAYDPSTGDVVCNERSIQGNLPTFSDRHTGTVAVQLNLPRDAAGSATFQVENVDAQAIALPEGAVVIPAACLLRETQSVSLTNLKRQ